MKLKVIFDFDFIMNEKMLNYIYLPIIGNLTINLYKYLNSQSLFNEQIGNNISISLESILTKLNIDNQQFEKAKNQLEAIGLIRSYIDPYKNDCLIIKLISCLNWIEFKNKTNLMNLLKMHLSEIEYEQIMYAFDKPNNLIGLVDVSTTFEHEYENIQVKQFDFINLCDELLKNTNQLIEINDLLKKRINDLYLQNDFTYQEILSLIYQSLYKVDNKLAIDTNIFELKVKSNLDAKKVHLFNKQLSFNRDLNIFLKDFNKEEFDKLIDNYKSLNSEQYLACIQSAPISKIDSNLIQALRTNYKLPDFIINLLIDFSILVNKGKIEPIYLQSIAITINRMNFNNVNLIFNHLQNTAKYKLQNN